MFVVFKTIIDPVDIQKKRVNPFLNLNGHIGQSTSLVVLVQTVGMIATRWWKCKVATNITSVLHDLLNWLIV